MKNQVLLLILFMSFLFLISTANAGNNTSEVIKIGVLAYKGKQSALQRWKGHADYLNKKLSPLQFKIIPLSYSNNELTKAVTNHQVDFVITNPGQYTELKIKGLVTHIATRRMKSTLGVLDQFGGTVITQAERKELNYYSDISKQRIVIPSFSSLGGWLVHLRAALEQGIDLRKHSQVTKLHDHHKVVMAIKNRTADIGFVRSDLLEEMAAKGEISLKEFKIVNEQKYNKFPYKVSTRLYPEWPFAIVTGTARDISVKVLAELLAMTANDDAAKKAGIYGWTILGQYNKVDELFREVNIEPYAKEPITFILVFEKYKLELFLLLAIICLLLISNSLRVVYINRKLHLENILRSKAENNQLFLNKELKCLYELASLSEKYHCAENYLQAIIEILPQACDSPEDIGIRISYNNLRFQTENFTSNHQYKHQDISIENKILGKLDFAYLKKPNKDSYERQKNFIETAVKQIENTLQRLMSLNNLKLIASVFENTNDGIIITDSDANIIDVNNSFTELTGYNRNEVIGKNTRLLSSGRHDSKFYQSMWKTLLEKGEWKGQIWNKKKNGEIYAELLNISAIKNENNNISKFIGVFSDITQYKKQQEKLEFLAHHDALTQLPNRILFRDRLKTSLALSRRSENLLAIAYLDLDGFKPVNDKHGHDAGDKLLIEVAKRIMDCVREGDSVARLGGDEFALLLSNLLNVTECDLILNRINTQIAKPFLINDIDISISASIGVTISPIDDSNIDNLLRHADQAMYAAKAMGRNQFHLFSFNQDKLSQTRHETLERIKSAYQNKEFRLYYQPKINMRSGAIVGIEVLLRWLHPQRGLLLPEEFLPLINGSELQVNIETWVLNQTFKQLQLMFQAGYKQTFALNISTYYLSSGKFGEDIISLFNKYHDIAGNSIEFEVQEAAVLDNIIEITKNLELCQNMGIHIILDNFGSGYSSLACFKQVNIDAINIDPKFVQGMLNNDSDYSVTDAIIGLGKSFQHPVIAKGVESEQHGLILLQMGCEIVQGDIISKAMEANLLIEWINNYVPISAWKKNFNKNWKKEDLPFVLVEYHHSAWIDNMLNFLKQKESNLEPPPTLSHTKCYFGKWYHGIGKKQYGQLLEFKTLGPIHKQVHEHAKYLCDLKKAGKLELLSEQTPQLLQLKEEMLEAISNLMVKVKLET